MSKEFIDYTANLKQALINQRVLVYVLLSLIVLLSGAMTYLSWHQPTFILPYGLNKKIRLVVHQLTPAYVSALALSDAATYFNIDATNIDEQQALFLSRVWPPSEKPILATFKQRSTYFHTNEISQQFYPYERYVTSSRQGVVIKGRLLRWLAGKCLLNRRIQLTLHYQAKQGHLYIDRWSYKNV